MSSIISRSAILTLLLVALTHAQAYDEPTTSTQNNKDEDGDPLHGPNDRFTEGTMIERLFEEIDLNKDGKLDKQEVNVYFQKQGAHVQDGLWEREDKNGDGVIERHEFARSQGGDEL